MRGNPLAAIGLLSGILAGGGGGWLIYFVSNRDDLLRHTALKITKENGFTGIVAEYIKKEEGEGKTSTTCQIWMDRGKTEVSEKIEENSGDECNKLIRSISWDNTLSAWLRVDKNKFVEVADHLYLINKDDYPNKYIQTQWEVENKNLKCTKKDGEVGSDRQKIIVTCTKK